MPPASFDARPILFGMITIVLAWLSRASLLRPYTHGFPRFFAWEAIAAQVLLSLPVWFRDWLSWHQILSWLLLCGSLVPLVLGMRALRLRGAPDAAARSAPELLAFERTTRLVSDGIFRYIRHPLYSSLCLLSWGVFLKEPSLLGGFLAVLATGLLLITAQRDEAECLQTFGAAYAEYMRRTRMFIPLIF